MVPALVLEWYYRARDFAPHRRGLVNVDPVAWNLEVRCRQPHAMLKFLILS